MKRRGHKRAIIATARMLLTCIYHMLHTGEDFCPSDFAEMSSPVIKRNQVFTDQSAIAYLAAQGYDVSSLKKTAV